MKRKHLKKKSSSFDLIYLILEFNKKSEFFTLSIPDYNH